MDATSIEQSGHTLDAIHPYVEQDLQDAVLVDLYPWVEAVFGVPRERVDKWTAQIGAQRWFHDDVIQTHLMEYCEAEKEPERYEPFCGLANRILDLARGNLVGIRDTESFPVDSLKFIQTSQCPVSKIPEHTQLGATRSLDITLTDGKAARRFEETSEFDWVDVLHYVELKYVKKLTDALAEATKDRDGTSGKRKATKVRS